MPYKEIGTEYPFKTPTKVPMDFLMEPNCLSGFVGYQSYGGTTAQDIDAISLSAVRSAIEGRGKVKILFMKLSWNVDAKITDLVFGAVWVTKTKVTAQATLESITADLMRVLKDLLMIQREDFDAYIDGSVAYEHIWDWNGETEEVYKELVLGWDAPSVFPYDEVKQAAEITILSKVTEEINKELAAYKPQVTKIEPYAEIITTEYHLIAPPGYYRYTEYQHRLKMSARVYFTTQEAMTEPLMAPKLAPIIIAALIKIIITLALITAAALVIYYAWATFVQSFLVKSSKVTTKTTTTVKTPIFDDEGNIIGYEETEIIEEKEEETVEPSWTGQLIMMAAIAIGALGIGAAVASALSGRRRD